MNSEDLDYILGRGRRERWIDYTIGAVFMLIMMLIAGFVITRIPIALARTPLTIDDVRILSPSELCPGEFLSWTSHVHVTEPAVIGIWTAVQNAATENILNHTRMEHPPVPRANAVDFDEQVHFKIPDLPPGDYVRIAAFALVNSDTEPIFLTVPFTVRDDCPPIE